jgi:hypothetical protein
MADDATPEGVGGKSVGGAPAKSGQRFLLFSVVVLFLFTTGATPKKLPILDVPIDAAAVRRILLWLLFVNIYLGLEFVRACLKEIANDEKELKEKGDVKPEKAWEAVDLVERFGFLSRFDFAMEVVVPAVAGSVSIIVLVWSVFAGWR